MLQATGVDTSRWRIDRLQRVNEEAGLRGLAAAAVQALQDNKLIGRHSQRPFGLRTSEQLLLPSLDS